MKVWIVPDSPCRDHFVFKCRSENSNKSGIHISCTLPNQSLTIGEVRRVLSWKFGIHLICSEIFDMKRFIAPWFSIIMIIVVYKPIWLVPGICYEFTHVEMVIFVFLLRSRIKRTGQYFKQITIILTAHNWQKWERIFQPVPTIKFIGYIVTPLF